jgi:hypothetical protein
VNYKNLLFDRILYMKAAMKVAGAREAAKIKTAITAAPAAPPLLVEPPSSAKAPPAHPAAPKAQIEESASTESIVADCLARFYRGSNGVNINDEFIDDPTTANWRAQQNDQPAPSKVTDEEFLNAFDPRAVQAAYEKQEAEKAAAANNIVPFTPFRVSK